MNFQKITSILCFIFFCITLLAQNKLEIYSPIEYNNKAHELLEEDEPDFLGAEKQFAKINENDSLYFEALYNRAYCLRSASKFEEALVVIEEGIQLNKEFLPDFYINKVSCLDSLKQYDKAIMVISEAVKRFPFNNDLNIAKGQVLESQGKYLETFEIYKQQILSAPLDVNGHLNMANLMIKSNALSQAILPLTTAIALYPERANNLNIIQTLEVIVSAKYDKEPIMDLSQLDCDFNEVDELISNYIALSDKYRINSKINYGYIKQLHLLLSEADDTKTDFFTTTYLNTLKPFLDDRFAHLAGLLSLSSKNKSHQAYCEKNMKGISEVYLEIRSKMNDLGGQIESPDPYIEGMVNYMFTSDGSIEGFGKQDPKTKNFYGKVVYISEDGAIQCRGELNKDALPINEWNWYYANGNTSRTSSFKNGKLDGPTQFFTENGTLSRTSNFKDDVLHGKVESYKLIGYKYEETNYVNGKQEGLKTGFYPDGSKSYEFHMKNDLEDGKYTYYYDDQSISNEGEAKEGELIGTALTYFRNGQISYSEEYLNGLLNGKYESYYQNGQLETKGLMKDGNKAGTWNTYSRSGKISSVEEYDFKGKKNGVIQLYDYKGRIENELTFKKGFCQSVTNYDSLGQVTNTHKILKNKLNFTLTNNLGNVVKKSTIIDGKLQGPYSYYNAHGQINVIEEYVDDLIQGKVLSYYYNGELYSETNYKDSEKNGLTIQYYLNGQMKSQQYYKNNQLHGRSLHYYLNGNISSDEQYESGMEHGKCHYYNADGSKYLQQKYNYGYLEEGTHFAEGKETVSFTLEKGGGKDEYYYDSDRKFIMGVNNYLGGSVHGKQLRYFKNGKIRSERTFRNGLLHGPYLIYHHNGHISKKWEYIDGKIEGRYEERDYDGNLLITREFENNMLHGKSTRYNDDGSIKTEVNYVYDSQDGYAKIYSGGEISHFIYFENDATIGISYLNEDGSMADLIPITKEESMITTFFSNGQKSAELSYNDGLTNGKSTFYYPNGNLRAESNYIVSYENGEQKTYYENGKLKSSKLYEYGILNGNSEVYHSNGKLKRTTPYLSDEIHGQLEEFDEQGNKISSLKFFGNVLRD